MIYDDRKQARLAGAIGRRGTPAHAREARRGASVGLGAAAGVASPISSVERRVRAVSVKQTLGWPLWGLLPEGVFS
jgi:hypothetical protein